MNYSERATAILATQTITPVVLEVTLETLKLHGPCADGWRKLLTALGSDYPKTQPINILTILETNDLDDALWALRAVTDKAARDREMRLFACDCAEMVLHLIPESDRAAFENSIAVSRRFAGGQAGLEELDAAWDAARDAAWDAARDAARAAAWDAARDAAWDAARDAARAAAWDAARDAAWDAARAASIQFLQARLTTSETAGS